MKTTHYDDDIKNINDILDIVKKHTGDSVDTNKISTVTFSYNPNKLLSKAYVIQHVSKRLRREVPIRIKESALEGYKRNKYTGCWEYIDWEEIISPVENKRIMEHLEKKLTKMKTVYFDIVSEIFATNPYFKKLRESLSEDEYLDFYIGIKGYNFRSFLLSINPGKLHKNIKGFNTSNMQRAGFRFYVGKDDIKDEGRKICTHIVNN